MSVLQRRRVYTVGGSGVAAGGKSFLGGYYNLPIGANAGNNFIPVYGTPQASVTSGRQAVAMPRSAVFSNMRLELFVNVAGAPGVLVLRVGNTRATMADTALSITIPAGNTSMLSNDVNTVAVAQNQFIEYRINQPAANNYQVLYVVVLA